MELEASDVIVGAMVMVFGLIGLALAAHARDDEMYVFGLSLAGFAVLFVFGQIRRHFDNKDNGRSEVRND